METTRLLVIDDQPVVKEGLGRFLEEHPDLSVVAFVDTFREGLAALRQTPVDVVLMELNLPDLDGAESTRLFLEEDPQVAIIIYTHHEDEASVYRALKAGARGYLLKSSPLEDIVKAVRQIEMDEYILSPDLSPTIVDFYLKHRDLGEDRLGKYQHLSEREKQVFRLLADGRPTQQIADILCISPKTVAKHRSSVKKKLSLNNAAEMAQYAISIGVVDVGDFKRAE